MSSEVGEGGGIAGQSEGDILAGREVGDYNYLDIDVNQ